MRTCSLGSKYIKTTQEQDEQRQRQQDQQRAAEAIKAAMRGRSVRAAVEQDHAPPTFWEAAAKVQSKQKRQSQSEITFGKFKEAAGEHS